MKLFEVIKKRAADNRRKETHGVIAYTREVGPICYQVSLRRNTPGIATLLLDSALDWWWESEGQIYSEARLPVPVQPFRRLLSRLTSVSSDDFASDFDYIDEEGEGLDITIFGLVKNDGSPLDTELLSSEVRSFLASEESRLEMVINLLPDSYYDALFVTQNPSQEVSTLLPAVGVIRENIVKTLPYKRFRLATLENVVSDKLH